MFYLHIKCKLKKRKIMIFDIIFWSKFKLAQPATNFFGAGWLRVRPNPPQPALFAGQNQPAPAPSTSDPPTGG